ncbi:ribonucleases P/MRP protein subunit POP1-like [Saccostrea cucullata]|uniref:ribonucleases P/MRP protein subunit POP1-like n=1 Tax=Saccostrea cuccullata TaxID=36930 RepID=UPI002ED2E284
MTEMEQIGRKRKFDGKADFAKKQRIQETVLSEAPQAINVVEYAKCRAAELQLLDAATKQRKVSQAVNGLMSISMRRRAMSHNIKRLPHRVREMVTIKANKHKKPSRRHRRRPNNLLQEYVRRQKTKVWLETHIWHAKRFKMIEKWGYRIPYQPTDKSSRASYRATQHHCQMIDVSYMCCIEVQGNEEDIISGVSRLCNSQTGLTIGAKMYLEGTREGSCVLYKQDQYPLGAICPVTFLWRPRTESHSLRQLWIWCHPASYNELWQELEASFSHTEGCAAQDISEEVCSCPVDEVGKGKTVSEIWDKAPVNNNSEEQEIHSEKKDEEEIKKIDNDCKAFSEKKGKGKQQKRKKETTQKPTEEQVIKVVNRKSQIGKILMTSLKDRLVRHRFIGPESQKVLEQTLCIADIMSNKSEPAHWWKQYFQDQEHSLGFNQQREFWEGVCQCRSAAELSPHCVIGLTVRDPRVIRAKKRNDSASKETSEAMMSDDTGAITLKISQDVSSSPLWKEEIRKTVTSTKKSDFEINQLKSEHVVPGTELILGDEESRIPVLLIQNQGVDPKDRNHSHYGSGWDLILPAGWSMAFWVASVYHGARAGGLRELQCLANEQQSEHFPEDFPDTQAGQAEENRIKSEKEAEHSRRPPAKRPNFRKLGMDHPFSWAWKQLVDEKDDSQDFYVLRGRDDLRTLRKVLNIASGKNKKCLQSHIDDALHASFQDVISRHKQSLVYIKIAMNSKGSPEEMGTISIPTQEDVNRLKADRFYVGPVKLQQKDPQQEEKKEKKRKIKLFKKGILNLPPKKTPEIKTENSESVDNGDREVIGYVKHGGFSLSSGQGAGKGFCSVLGLEKLHQSLPDQKNLVLIRNPRTLQYRFARISI